MKSGKMRQKQLSNYAQSESKLFEQTSAQTKQLSTYRLKSQPPETSFHT